MYFFFSKQGKVPLESLNCPYFSIQCPLLLEFDLASFILIPTNIILVTPQKPDCKVLSDCLFPSLLLFKTFYMH